MLKRFLKSCNGNIAITTAFALPPMVALSFGALEYGMFSGKQQLLDSAADSAALTGVNEAVIAYRTLENVDLEDLIQKSAESAFYAQTNSIEYIDVSKFEAIPTIEDNILTVDVSYDAVYETQFYKFAGEDEIELAGVSNATASTAAYANITLLFDSSASMGIGATLADEAELARHTNCAFACHFDARWKSTSPEKNGISKEDPNASAEENARARIANENAKRLNFDFDIASGQYLIPDDYTDYEVGALYGAQTRLDVSKTGAINAINELDRLELLPEQITFNVASFDNHLTRVVRNGDNQAANFSYIRDAIESGVTFKHWDGGTNAAFSILNLLNDIPDSGSGRRADDRIQYVVILSDGMQNSAERVRTQHVGDPSVKIASGYWDKQNVSELYPLAPQRQFGAQNLIHPFNPVVCDWLEDKGIKPLFITTNYIRPTSGEKITDSRFGFIDTLHRDLQKNLVTCTGKEDFVLSADTPQEIQAAFVELFGILASPLRLN